MSADLQDPFFRVPRTRHPTSAGVVELPILYHDCTQVQAYFLCEPERVEQALAGSGLRAGLHLGRRALVAMAFYEYRGTSIGSYNEVGLAVPVVAATRRPSAWTWPDLFRRVDHPRRDVGYRVLHLPVTTAAANAAGRELWGLPKFVTEIPFAFDAECFRGAVLDPADGSTICALEGRPGIGLPSPTLDLLLYSELAGQRLRTTVNTRGHTRGFAAGSVRLEIGGSQHPMAETLRTLGLHGASPLLLGLTPDFQSRLNAGVATASADQPARTPTPAHS